MEELLCIHSNADQLRHALAEIGYLHSSFHCPLTLPVACILSQFISLFNNNQYPGSFTI